jgi:hypothetical protein
MHDINLDNTPVVIFCYNRLGHVAEVIEGLKSNKFFKSINLIFYIDGPKSTQDLDIQNELVLFISDLNQFNSVTIYRSHINLGLSKSIITGVEKTFLSYNQAIFLEDDTVPSSNFIEYAVENLNFYKDHEDVISIHGYCYPVDELLPDFFFIKGADCWGWATWKDSWNLFNSDGKYLRAQIDALNLKSEFDFSNSYPYFQMLEDQINGKNDSWAIRWYASAFLANKLTLYPGRSLIKNIGMDGTGTHSGVTNIFEVKSDDSNLVFRIVEIEENQKARDAFTSWFRKSTRPKFKFSIKTLLVILKFYLSKMLRRFHLFL